MNPWNDDEEDRGYGWGLIVIVVGALIFLAVCMRELPEHKDPYPLPSVSATLI